MKHEKGLKKERSTDRRGKNNLRVLEEVVDLPFKVELVVGVRKDLRR